MKSIKTKKGATKYELSTTKYVSCRCMSSAELESVSPNKRFPMRNENSPAKLNQITSLKVCLIVFFIVRMVAFALQPTDKAWRCWGNYVSSRLDRS